MRCQDIERLILEAEESGLSREDNLLLEEHLARCRECARFAEFREQLRTSLQNIPAPVLPPRLGERVQSLCRTELSRHHTALRRPVRQEERARVPLPIWGAFAVLTVLTGGFLIPGVEELLANQAITLKTVPVLILILQNSLMLFFLPIIMRGRRSLPSIWRPQNGH